jgi:hypothetical protein
MLSLPLVRLYNFLLIIALLHALPLPPLPSLLLSPLALASDPLQHFLSLFPGPSRRARSFDRSERASLPWA